MTTHRTREYDITSAALACGLATTILKHFNKVTPWGARRRSADDYTYAIRMNSRNECHVWMRLKDSGENIMYFIFNEKIGALQSSDADRCHVSMLCKEEILCITQARQQILEVRLMNS